MASQGDTFEEACQNLIEAVELRYRGEDRERIEPSPAVVPIEVNLSTPARLAG